MPDTAALPNLPAFHESGDETSLMGAPENVVPMMAELALDDRTDIVKAMEEENLAHTLSEHDFLAMASAFLHSPA